MREQRYSDGAPGRPPRVLHVLPGLAQSGAEILCLHLCRRLGRDHAVLTPSGRGPMRALFREQGIEVFACTPNDLRRVRAFAPDVIHGWMLAGNVLAYTIQRLCAPTAALLWSLHLERPLPLRARWRDYVYLRLARGLLRRDVVDRLVFVGEESYAAHRRDGFLLGCGPDDRTKTSVIYGGVDTGLHCPDAGHE